ncbi:helix-turn-helix transcriptional regulator [Phytoactinopolyspora halotolerans]|uniref:WYL domain-containing protein n=1 Tax=Phytoactinopolyspora halotolerans TaxID=1981512 RepID=A0A6L9SEA4_9ACTN|nr:WYL domain-containing protein [Phytoactinopolyspora halotolerans]NEE02954.1 WYL domain-containing protein [Phytoactinopolyspora halotolerans]
MNRTDRLYALTEELRRAATRGRTAARLAALFEVSPRTIKRDVLALQESGLPIWAQPGPGGGYVLDPAATLPPVNFTPAQAVAVAVALASVRDAPFAADGASALAKVFDVLDDESRRRADDLGALVWVNDDPVQPPPGATRGPASGGRAIEEALRRRVVVVLDYIDAQGTPTRRRVEPMMMALTYGHWYLIGWCRRRDAVRWFRWDRIRDAHATPERVVERDLSVIGEFPATARSIAWRAE